MEYPKFSAKKWPSPGAETTILNHGKFTGKLKGFPASESVFAPDDSGH